MKEKVRVLAEFDRGYMASRSFVMGIDEAGRGALAGPVCAAAAVIPLAVYDSPRTLESLKFLNDSKQLSATSREELYRALDALKKNGVIDFEAAFADVGEIEKLNILGATQLAMARAADALNERGALRLLPRRAADTLFGETARDLARAVVLIDGKPMGKFPYTHQAVVKGDAKSLAIAAASIVAKVTRDRYMDALSQRAGLTRYGFEKHKGYGTAAHLQNLMLFGASPEHRPSFLKKLRAEPVKDAQGTFGF